MLAWILQAAHERALQTSHQPYYCLFSLIMALIPSRWINIFIPSLFEPEGSSSLESKKGREKERKKRRLEEGAQEKGWQMEGWINVEMNQQQSNKATQDFLVLPIIRLIYFPLDTIITVLANYFFSLNPFLMAGCVFFFFVFPYDRVSKVEFFFFVSCCATLSPQTVSTDCTGRGTGEEREEARRQGGGRWVCVCVGGGRRRPWRMGQAPDQHFPGPVTVPEYSRHVCTVCEHKWQTDLGVCFVFPPSFVFRWCSGRLIFIS